MTMEVFVKKLLALCAALLSTSLFAAGFSGGDTFTNVDLDGRLSVSCMGSQGGPSYGVANCRMDILNPGEYSYFVGPKIDADSVSLQATWENGKKSKIKTEKYDGTTGKSKKSFNLWISTLLQRPLLDSGKNTVSYSLTKNGTVVEQGEFIVNVVSGGTRYCQRTGFYTSSNNQDCAQPAQFCDRYFRDYNYCQ